MKRKQHQPLRQQSLAGVWIDVVEAGRGERVTVDSPAVEVMTDLQRIPAASIAGDTSLSQTHHTMIMRGVRMLFVAGEDGRIQGLITAADLMGERPLRAARERGAKVGEIAATHVMTPIEAVEAVSLEDVLRAEVGHVVATLQRSGRQHALVVEHDKDGRSTIRGIFSASQISRQLGIPLHGTEIARTFAEIEAAIAA